MYFEKGIVVSALWHSVITRWM